MLVWNILTTLASRVGVTILALGSSVVLARFLGADGRGLFAFVLLLPDFAKSFGLLGIEQSNVVYAGIEPGKRNILVWHSAIIAAAVGCVVVIAGIVFLSLGAPGFPALIRGPLWIYWIPLSIVPLALASEYLSAILRGMNRIFLLNMLEVGMKLFSFVFLFVLIGWFRLDVPGAVWADFAASVATLIVTVGLLLHVGAIGAPAFDRSLFRRSAKFALPAHSSTVISYLNYRIDQFFIAAWLLPQELGYYVIAVGLAERLWLPTGAIANALLPHLTNSVERDPALPAILARHVMLWVGTACLVVFVMADLVIEILYSAEFAPAAGPLRWLLPGILSLSIGRVLVAELLAREKPQYTVWASGIATLTNVIGNFILVPRMGITGSAIASSVSYSVLSLFLMTFYLRETGLGFSVLFPRRKDLLIYGSLRNVLKDNWLREESRLKSSAVALLPPFSRQFETGAIRERRPSINPFESAAEVAHPPWPRKLKEFYDHPHFPLFLLLPLRRISPTLARYVQYGRYNPNTEQYWNQRYRSGSYQTEEDWRYQALDHEILKMIRPGSEILDVGCGTGRIMEKLRDQRDCNCVGIDISTVAINHVRAKGLRGFKCELPNLASDLTDKNFDVCTIMETLEHLSSPQTTLQRLSEILKDGGSFIVSVPDDCMKPDEFDEHVSSFDRNSLCDLLGRYCEIDRVLSVEAGGNNHLIVRGKKPRGADSAAPQRNCL